VRSVQILQDEIAMHREPMRRVDLTGTYLKYLGSRADICDLGHQLMSVRLRWKRLVQHAAHVNQQLRSAHNETKRVIPHVIMKRKSKNVITRVIHSWLDAAFRNVKVRRWYCVGQMVLALFQDSVAVFVNCFGP